MNGQSLSLYQTFEQHTELLHDKGYLGEPFGNNAKVGSWLLEFRRTFEQAQSEAKMDDLPRKFIISLFGKFNAGLQTVKFDFRYSYDPNNDTLSLNSLYAHIGKYNKPYYFHNSDELPNVQEVYKSLAAPDLSNNDIDLLTKAYYDFHRDKNPENDHKEERPQYIPPKKITRDDSNNALKNRTFRSVKFPRQT